MANTKSEHTDHIQQIFNPQQKYTHNKYNERCGRLKLCH